MKQGTCRKQKRALHGWHLTCHACNGAALLNARPNMRLVLRCSASLRSSPSTPIFFVLFPGYSPSSQIEAYARTGGLGTAIAVLSSGRSSSPSSVHVARGMTGIQNLCFPGVSLVLLPRPTGCQCPLLCCPPAVGKTAERGNFAVISMGQGQEGPAERLLDRYLAEVRGRSAWQSGNVGVEKETTCAEQAVWSPGSCAPLL